MSRLLEIEDLVVAYGPIQALSGVSFAVEEGSTVALLGPNGAGKSTLLRAVAGLHHGRAGSIRFAGRQLRGMDPHQIVRCGISLVPERRLIFENLTVQENLDLGAYALRHEKKEVVLLQFNSVMDMFPALGSICKKQASLLSGGQQQMLAIARGLMSRPRLLLLDEPSLGLSPKLVNEVFERVAAISRSGTSVVVVEQNASIALRIADYGYVLNNGRIVLEGHADELKDRENVKTAYLGKI